MPAYGKATNKYLQLGCTGSHAGGPGTRSATKALVEAVVEDLWGVLLDANPSKDMLLQGREQGGNQLIVSNRCWMASRGRAMVAWRTQKQHSNSNSTIICC